MNDDGLQDAVLANVIRGFVDLGFRTLGARVVSVFVEAGRRHYRGRSCWGGGYSRRRRCRFGRGRGIQQIRGYPAATSLRIYMS